MSPQEQTLTTPADTIAALESQAARIRGSLVEMSHRARAAHLGSALSCIDILTVLYWKILNIGPDTLDDPLRDRFILSKGHAASAIYATLAHRGLIDRALLETYAREGSALEEHPGPGKVPGVEAATGSLGHGLSIGAGLALSAGILNQDFKVYVLVSDGECNEGSLWEAAMFASGRPLSNLTVIVDFNKWQATGRSCEITGLDPLSDKFAAFGWDSFDVDGHDMSQLIRCLKQPGTGRPRAVIAHTVKGKGVSFMEDDNNWHYRIPTAREVEKARAELGLAP